jgi:invasion protein IalB
MSFTGPRYFIVAIILGVLLLLPISISSAIAQNPHAKIFGDWRIRCNTPTGAPADCTMFQNVVVKGSGQPVLQAVFGYMDGAKTPVGVFVTPLGIYLPPGLTLQIDEGQVYEMNFEICGRSGCRVRFSVDENLLKTFKVGNTAKIVFQSGVQKPVEIPLSLKGFTAALKQVR